MYIEISEYFFLFEINISNFFIFLNNGFFIPNFNIECDIHYMFIREYYKFMMILFFSKVVHNKQVTLFYRGDFYEFMDKQALFYLKKRL